MLSKKDYHLCVDRIQPDIKLLILIRCDQHRKAETKEALKNQYASDELSHFCVKSTFFNEIL